MTQALRNRTALVTGASSGIGKAIALGLAEKGALVCFTGRKLERLEIAAGQAGRNASRVRLYRADLSKDDEVAGLARSVTEDTGGVDIIVHSAGAMFLGELEHSPVSDFDSQYRINVRSPYLLTQALLPGIKARRGQIVFVNSSAALKARANVGQYSATKHAMKAIADSLREEVNGDGVRVVSVYTGRTATPMIEAVLKSEGKAYRPEMLLQPHDVAEVVINALCLPRSAEVTDIHVRPLQKS